MKVKHLWIRLLCFMFALVMTVGLLAACKDEKEPVKQTTETQPDVQPDVDDGYEKDSLPELDYDNEKVIILHWNDTESDQIEFEADENSISVIEEAVYTRNVRVESRLNIALEFIGVNGNAGYTQSFVNTVTNSATLGADGVSIVAGYSQTMAAVAVKGLLGQLQAQRYIDLDRTWWPNSLTDEITINGNLYFVSGDISTKTLHSMYGVFFNKDLLASVVGLEDPYDLVDNDEWTLEKMLSMAEQFGRLDDGDGQKSSGDTFGLINPWISFDAYVYGSGIKSTKTKSNGTVALDSSFTGAAMSNLLDKMAAALKSDWAYGLANDQDVEWGDGLPGSDTRFKTGKALFLAQRVSSALTSYSKVEGLHYGLVPTPKWDSTQTDYRTALANGFTLYGVSSGLGADEAERAGAVLECMASTSYRVVTPVLFENAMKLRASQDADAAKMYDIVRTGIVFDIGRIFGQLTGDYTQTAPRNCLQKMVYGTGEGESAWNNYKANGIVSGTNTALDDALSTLGKKS